MKKNGTPIKTLTCLPFLYHIHENLSNCQNCENNHVVLIVVSLLTLCCVVASTHRVVCCVVVLFCHFDATLLHSAFVVATPRPIVRRLIDRCIPSPVASRRVIAKSILLSVMLSCPTPLRRVSLSYCVVMVMQRLVDCCVVLPSSVSHHVVPLSRRATLFGCRDILYHCLASC